MKHAPDSDDEVCCQRGRVERKIAKIFGRQYFTVIEDSVNDSIYYYLRFKHKIDFTKCKSPYYWLLDYSIKKYRSNLRKELRNDKFNHDDLVSSENGEGAPLPKALCSNDFSDDELNALKESLPKLRQKHRQVIEYHYYEELSFEQIAEIMEISQWDVYKCHERAIDKLLKLMRGDGKKIRNKKIFFDLVQNVKSREYYIMRARDKN